MELFGKSVKPESDWTALPRDILVDICKLVLKSRCAEDFMSFRGVCSSWRAVTINDMDDEYLSSINLFPFLMLPDKKGSRGFYSVSKGKVCMRLPMSDDKQCIESGFGWLLAKSRLDDHKEEKVDLLNPFTGIRIQLPHCRDHGKIRRSVLSANPSHNSDYVLVVLANFCPMYWKPGFKNWVKIDIDRGRDNYRVFFDVMYSNRDQKFYSVDQRSCLWVWDTAGADTRCAKKLSFSFILDEGYGEKYLDKYLVESSDGELLLVTRNTINYTVDPKDLHTEFRVYPVDVINNRFGNMVTSLKDAILVGHNAAFCFVPPPDSQDIIQSNSIYFTGTLFYKGMGIYSLKDGSIQRFHQPVENFSFIGPPVWVVPSSLSLR